MLIDTINIPYSSRFASEVIANPDQGKLIRKMKDVLLSVGWTLVDSLFARTFILVSGGFPIADGIQVTFPKTPVTFPNHVLFLTIGDTQYAFFDPANEVPLPAPAGGVWVGLGTTSTASMDNLIASIEGGGLFHAAFNSLTGGIDLVAVSPGPDYNLLTVKSDANSIIGINPDIGGGGYIFECTESTSVYQVTVIGRNNFNPDAQMLFTFNLNGTAIAPMRMRDVAGAIPSYKLIANQYGFALFAHSHDVSGGTSSIFCMAPQFPSGLEVPPTESFFPTYAVLVLGPNAVGGQSFWTGQYGVSEACLNGPPYVGAGLNPWARVLAFRSPNIPLFTPFTRIELDPLITGVYATFGEDGEQTTPGYVVGKLWDCALVSDFIDTEINIDGKHFVTLGYNVSPYSGQTICSLVMTDGAAVSDPSDIKKSLEFQQTDSEIIDEEVAVGNVAY